MIDFAAGGTGGHLQPALALAEELERRSPRWQCRFLIAGRPVEREFLAEREVVEVFPGFRSRPSPLRLDQWLGGIRRLVADRRHGHPDLLVAVGGYVSAVAVLARTGVPMILLEPDRIPGKVCRVLRPMARRVLRQWPDGADTQRVTTSGMPLRWRGVPRRRTARLELGLEPEAPTLLVCGGSQGSRAINQRVVAGLDDLRSMPELQLIHLTGEADFKELRDRYASLDHRVVVAPFRADMARLYAAADLIVARAGGMTVAEIAAAGRSAVFVPYPHHANDHQAANAGVLVDVGAATMVREEDCPEREFLARHILPRLDSPEDLRRAEKAAAALGRPHAAQQVADVIESILEEAPEGAA